MVHVPSHAHRLWLCPLTGCPAAGPCSLTCPQSRTERPQIAMVDPRSRTGSCVPSDYSEQVRVPSPTLSLGLGPIRPPLGRSMPLTHTQSRTGSPQNPLGRSMSPQLSPLRAGVRPLRPPLASPCPLNTLSEQGWVSSSSTLGRSVFPHVPSEQNWVYSDAFTPAQVRVPSPALRLSRALSPQIPLRRSTYPHCPHRGIGPL